MKYLSKEEIKNKKVLLRCDFNVPVVNEKISDDSKIQKSFKTINYLLDNCNTVIILSHFGRVKKEEDKVNNSLRIVYEYLKKYYDLEFIENPLDLSKVENNSKKCYLVENTRFTDVPSKRESVNDLDLAKYWSKYADVFVVDAFASLHRAHSSLAGLSKYLETYAGFLVETEVTNLQKLIECNAQDLLVIMGGAKVDDKIKIISDILKKCHKLILTGGILNTFLKVMGYNIGKSLVSNDEEVLNIVKDLIDNNKDKIFFTNEFIVKRDNENIKVKIEEVKDNDIIYDNIVSLEKYIEEEKIAFLNGTCGMVEDPAFAKGTTSILQDLKNSKLEVYVGGGDSAAAVSNFGFSNAFKYVSSGGGATLEYVSSNHLKAIDYIEENG